MKTLEQIKNDYAISKGFVNFHDIKKQFRNRDITFFEFGKHLKNCDALIQKECLKLASESEFTFSKRESLDSDWIVYVKKESITNENNIIK